jgi:uncharacterized protein YehS (DUF1456 family)
MNNNDILIRLRYAFDISDKNMREIFKLGGVDMNKTAYQLVMTKQKKDENRGRAVSRHDLEAFFNGFIISQRGQRQDENGHVLPPDFRMLRDGDINNVAIKKIKTAMAYKNEDLLGFMKAAGFKMSKNELTDILRGPQHPKYKVAGDQFLRKLLLGITITNRPEVEGEGDGVGKA